jgi:hypothetical protein
MKYLSNEKGARGYALYIKVTFAKPITFEHALSIVNSNKDFTVELYSKAETNALVGSAQLVGPLKDITNMQETFNTWMQTQIVYIEGGLRAFLRSHTGHMEWMPWRNNKIIKRSNINQISFEEGVKYIIE